MTGSSIKSGHSGKSAAGSHHSSGEGHPRPVYLVAYRSATFKSHWGLFIPNKDDKRHKVGRLIHIEGSVQEGFIFEIRRNYDISKTRNVPYPLILLGTCSDHFLIDNAHTIRDGDYHKDHLARDPFEKLMASVPAPGKSLRTQADHPVSSPSVLGAQYDLKTNEKLILGRIVWFWSPEACCTF